MMPASVVQRTDACSRHLNSERQSALCFPISILQKKKAKRKRKEKRREENGQRPTYIGTTGPLVNWGLRTGEREKKRENKPSHQRLEAAQ
jgi:hypothetical protein